MVVLADLDQHLAPSYHEYLVDERYAIRLQVTFDPHTQLTAGWTLQMLLD